MQQICQTKPTLSATLLVQMLDGMLASFDQPLSLMRLKCEENYAYTKHISKAELSDNPKPFYDTFLPIDHFTKVIHIISNHFLKYT